jgi:hypothetical protein
MGSPAMALPPQPLKKEFTRHQRWPTAMLKPIDLLSIDTPRVQDMQKVRLRIAQLYLSFPRVDGLS